MRVPLSGWFDPEMPIEERVFGDRYLVRAELPGLDPATEISVMVVDNEVTIEIRRPVHLPGPADGEFHTEPVRRTLRLPRGANDDSLTAAYDDEGILELVVELTKPRVIGRSVPITTIHR
jgi:HSP20 family molecular chaperone IbpA